MSKKPEPVGIYPGRAETFVVHQPQAPKSAHAGWWVGWRVAEPWEAVVVERAYARLMVAAAELVRVAGRDAAPGFTPGGRGEDLRINLVT